MTNPSTIYLTKADVVFDIRQGIISRAEWCKRNGGRHSLHTIPKFDAFTLRGDIYTGPLVDELGRTQFELGTVGLLLLAALQGRIEYKNLLKWTATQMDAIACDELLRCAGHLSSGTLPPDSRPDERGVFAHMYNRNASIFAAIGLPAPHWDA